MKNVAVVGAGAAGLVSARELLRLGHRATLFEQSTSVGGVWVYDGTAESDSLGNVGLKDRCHGSLYASLRTNLPRDLMAFFDYSFDSSGGGDDSWPRYIHHSQVLDYLQRFAREHSLVDHIEFEHRVDHVAPRADLRWNVTVTHSTTRQTRKFDAVMICNGHYFQPRVPKIPGISTFPGKLLHSHNYRKPDQFRNQRVAILGSAASGSDLAGEISRVASSVVWCAEAFAGRLGASMTQDGIIRCSTPVRMDSAGRLWFCDRAPVENVDAFVFCTGYRYTFPFLAESLVTVEDNWVHPLYLDMVPPRYPSLAFIGLPFAVIPFPLFEVQARWFSHLLSGNFALPSPEAMVANIEEKATASRNAGIQQRHFHKLGSGQVHYMNVLAAQYGGPSMPAWFSRLMQETRLLRQRHPADFRDRPTRTHGPTVISD